MSDGLLEWLTAILDEHGQIALAAQEEARAPWSPRRGMVAASATVRNGAMHPDEDLWDNEGSETLETGEDVARHIALHDPAVVLADIAAKRAIIEQHGFYLAGGQRERMCDTCGGEGVMSVVDWPCPTIRSLASAYAHHDGYFEEWKP